MNKHDWKHYALCFEYHKECRGSFPRQCGENTKFEEDKVEKGKCTLWRSLLKDDIAVYPLTVNPNRPLGSQYLNTHSKYTTRALGCNSNVQIGSPRCMFYVVSYSTKSTQKDNMGFDFDRDGNQVI